MLQVAAPPRDQEALEIPRLGERASRALTRNRGGAPATRMGAREIRRSAGLAGYSLRWKRLVGRQGGGESVREGGPGAARRKECAAVVKIVRTMRLLKIRLPVSILFEEVVTSAPPPQRLSCNSDGDPAVVKFHEQEGLITCGGASNQIEMWRQAFSEDSGSFSNIDGSKAPLKQHENGDKPHPRFGALR